MDEDALRELFDEYEWIHLTLGLFGNTLFFSGSVLFLLDLQPVGVPSFVVGSFLMLVDSFGSILAKRARNEL